MAASLRRNHFVCISFGSNKKGQLSFFCFINNPADERNATQQSLINDQKACSKNYFTGYLNTSYL